MNKVYETPEIIITRFQVNRNVMVELETGNMGPGDGWNAGVDDGSGGEYDNPDLEF